MTIVGVICGVLLLGLLVTAVIGLMEMFLGK